MATAANTPTPASGLPVSLLSETELRDAVLENEEVHRRSDARGIELAHEVAYRSRPQLPKTENLANRHGEARASALLEKWTHISSPEARRRILLGAKTQPRQLFGQVLAPEYPFVAAKLTTGEIAPDTALLIIRMLEECAARKVMPERLAVAEEALAENATEVSTDLVKAQTNLWQSVLDPDGAEPEEDRAWSKRCARIGSSRNGLTEIFLLAPTIDVALITALFTEGDKLTTQPRFLSVEEQAAQDAAPEITAGPHGEDQLKFRDPRSFGQRHYDLLLGYLRCGLRAAETGGTGARSLATINVIVTAKDLEAGTGVGWAEGISTGISVAEICRLVDSDGAHPTILGRNGQIVAYGDRQRGFSEKQRRAIITRDGDTCLCGCGTPAAACDGHHIIAYENGGATEVDNGVLICPPHHRWLTQSGFEMRMIRGRPHILAPPYLNPEQTWRPLGNSRTAAKNQLDKLGW